jgi:type IV pilus assembly protein PilC
LIHKATIARFSRTFATLISGGIPVMQALDASGSTSGSIKVQEAIKVVSEKIHDGKNISIPLRESEIFPPMVVQMVAIGEETGALPSLLNKIAEFYEDEVATITKGLSALLEPILLVVVGVVVGIMLVSLYLPIFSAVTQIGQ